MTGGKTLGKVLSGFFKFMIVFIVIGLAAFGILQRMGHVDVDTLFHKQDALSGIDAVAAALATEIENGVDGTVTLYVTDVTEDELMKINYSLITLNGSVSTITSHPETNGVTKVDFDIVRSDNSYVYACYAKGEEIPADRPQAKALYDKVNAIINTVVSPWMTDYEKEVALHDYLVGNCSYSHGSADNENEYRAYGALVEGEAVCNGYAEAMALLLSCAGITNEVINGHADDELHAWNLVEIDGEWYHLDATWDDPINKNVILHTFFNVDDEVMAERHSWDRENYRTCDSMMANYYNQNHTSFSDYQSFTNAISAEAAYDPYAMIECAVQDYDPNTYDLNFLFQINGINSLQYSQEGSGDYTVLVLYLNR